MTLIPALEGQGRLIVPDLIGMGDSGSPFRPFRMVSSQFSPTRGDDFEISSLLPSIRLLEGVGSIPATGRFSVFIALTNLL